MNDECRTGSLAKFINHHSSLPSITHHYPECADSLYRIASAEPVNSLSSVDPPGLEKLKSPTWEGRKKWRLSYLRHSQNSAKLRWETRSQPNW